MGMIKRILILWMMLLGLCISAQAEPYVYSSDQTPLVFFDCEDFDDEIPVQLRGVFDEWIQEDDQILSGTVCTTRYRKYPETALSADALLALERDEKILLLGGRDSEDREIPFTYEDGYARFTVGGLVRFAMYRIL